MMKRKPLKTERLEYSKLQVGGVTIGLFCLLFAAIILISFLPMEAFQAQAIVQIIGGVTTLTGVAITNYSVKAGVENTSKIKKAYQEAASLTEPVSGSEEAEEEEAAG